MIVGLVWYIIVVLGGLLISDGLNPELKLILIIIGIVGALLLTALLILSVRISFLRFLVIKIFDYFLDNHCWIYTSIGTTYQREGISIQLTDWTFFFIFDDDLRHLSMLFRRRSRERYLFRSSFIYFQP